MKRIADLIGGPRQRFRGVLVVFWWCWMFFSGDDPGVVEGPKVGRFLKRLEHFGIQKLVGGVSP